MQFTSPRRWSMGLMATLLAGVLVACSTAASPTPQPTPAPTAAPGDTPAPATPTPVASLNHGFRNGDVLTLITGTNPGGGFDFNLRTIQPFMEKYLREITGTNIRVIVENVPGGGQRVGYETMARAKADGLTVALLSHPIAAGHQILSNAKYDVTKLSYVGQLSVSNKGFLVRKELALPSRDFKGIIERSQQQPILWAVAGAATDLVIMRALLEENNVDLKIDQANFDSTSDMVASLLRSEVEVVWTTLSTIVKTAKANQELEVIGSTACYREISAPDLPTIVDEKIPGADQICKLADGSPRVLAGPPGIPADTMEVLRMAWKLAVEDPAHDALSVAGGVDLTYGDHTIAEKLAPELVALYEKYKDILK